jgi:hypothetical protein
LIASVLILLWLGPASAELNASEKNVPPSQLDQQDLRRVAEKLKTAILKEDIDGILRHIDPDGLRCTDTKVPYQQVRRDLHNKNSDLYLSLFDTARFVKRCGRGYPSDYPAISDREFFSRAENETIEIEISERNKERAKVTIRSSVKGHYPRELYFHKVAGKWKVSHGFIVGSCTCG